MVLIRFGNRAGGQGNGGDGMGRKTSIKKAPAELGRGRGKNRVCNHRGDVLIEVKLVTDDAFLDVGFHLTVAVVQDHLHGFVVAEDFGGEAVDAVAAGDGYQVPEQEGADAAVLPLILQIGRASCRERVYHPV